MRQPDEAVFHRPAMGRMRLLLLGVQFFFANAPRDLLGQYEAHGPPVTHAIILTTYGVDEDTFWGLQAGAKVSLLKNVGRQVLLATLRAVHAVQTPASPAAGVKLIGHLGYKYLSDREPGVLKLMVKGMVKFHVNYISSKLTSEQTQRG